MWSASASAINEQHTVSIQFSTAVHAVQRWHISCYRCCWHTAMTSRWLACQSSPSSTAHATYCYPYKSLVFFAGAARSNALMSAIYLHSGGLLTTERHISDTCTMRWEIQYVHPQSGRTPFVDTLHHAAAGRPAAAAVCNGENLQTNIYR